MSLIVSPEATADLSEIYDYISFDSPIAAERELERLYANFQRLANRELSGVAVRLRRGGAARRWPVPPYRVYFRHVGDETHILRVHHGARRPIER